MNRRNNVRKKSIHRDLIALVVTSITLTVLMLCVVSIYFVYRSTEQSLEKSVKETSELISQKISDQIETYARLAESIAIYQDTANASGNELLSYLNKFKEQYGFNSIDYLDSHAKSLLSGKQYEQSSAAGQTTGGEAFLSDPMISGDTVSFEYAYPYKNHIILIDLPYAIFGDVIDQVRIGTTGSTYILNNQGAKVVHSDFSLVQKQQNNLVDVKQDPELYAEVAALESDMVQGNSGFGFYTWKGDRKFGAYSPIADTNGWSVNVTALSSEFMGGMTRAAIVITVLGICSLVAATLVAVGRTRQIINPIKNMTQAIEQMYQGNFQVNLTVKRMDEVGLVSGKLNDMAKIVRGIIGDISRILEQMAEGNLDVEPNGSYPGEFGTIKNSMESILQNLNTSLRQIDSASLQVQSSAEQVSAGAQALSQGTTEQASAIEELTVTIEEVSGHIKTTASDAENANAKVVGVSGELTACSDKMQELVKAIDRINATSGEIAKINKTIEDIAFQTNILALNAAVEAARAGTAGKSFTVVADEVRSLANKSAEAAQSTTGLIQDSLSAVKNGTVLAGETAESLYETVRQAEEVTGFVGRISQSAQSQAQSVEQIMQGIEQISAVVQTNSATSEESAASSQELSAQANLLKQQIDHFQLKAAAGLSQEQMLTEALEPEPDTNVVSSM